MRGGARRSGGRILAWLTLTAAAAAGTATTATAASLEQKHVLVLYSTRRDAQISMVGDRELPRLLDRGLQENLDFHAEYLDFARFPGVEYETALKDFLRSKYEHLHLDVVIAMSENIVGFLSQYRKDLFPDSPIVYFTNSADTARPANSTGITWIQNLSRTVTLAAALQPDLRRVFVVSGTDEGDRQIEAVARAQLAQFDDQPEITYLSGLATTDLEHRLADLPPNSAVYYLLVSRDAAGDNFNALAYLERVTAASNAPVYCWVDSAMDRGIVGGSLKSQMKQTEALGELALRVLRGEAADSIAISSPDLNVEQVDWRQLRRWGLSESRVPAGTLVRFKEPSAWDRYGIYIAGGIVLLLAETGLIAGLLIQMTMRRRAEARERESQAELHVSYERIRDLGSRLLTAQDTERARIARELHDDISQQLALLTIDLELLGRANRTEPSGLATQVRDRAASISKSVHDLSHQLYPSRLRLVGLVGALNALQREVSRSGMTVTLNHDHVPASLPLDVTLCVFRVVQEALQNASKHSHAGVVSIRLTGRSNGLELTISDDGEGFDVDEAWGRGVGLYSMRERVQACGGILDIQSAPGSGTRLRVKVPLPGDRTTEAVAG